MKVFALIPTHNRKLLLTQCLDSLSKQTYKDLEIVVIDDGSIDGTTKQLEKFNNATILHGDGNLWWTGSIRMGVEYVKKHAQKGDFILIQNDDTWMRPTFVEELVKLSRKYKRMILGTIVRQKKDNQIVYNTHIVRHGLLRPYILASTSEIICADTLSGRGTLIPIEVFKKVENFSEILKQYASDYDFFCRARKAGFKIGMAANIETISTNTKKNLSNRIKEKQKISLREFKQLYFSIRSSNNLFVTTYITVHHVSGLKKIEGLAIIFGAMVKTFVTKCLF